MKFLRSTTPLLVISWDLSGLSIQECHAGQIQKQAHFPWDGAPWEFENEEGCKSWLTAQLKAGGFTAEHILLQLPRQQLFQKLIEIPALKSDLRNQAVWMQAEMHSPRPIEKMYVGFHFVNSETESDTQCIMLAYTPREELTFPLTVLEACGHRVLEVGSADWCLPSISFSKNSPFHHADGLHWVVQVEPRTLTVSLYQQGIPLSSVHHRTRTGEMIDAETVKSLYKRLSSNVPEGMLSQCSPEVWFIGGKTELQNEVETVLQQPVLRPETELPNNISPLATARSRNLARIDFLHPEKQPTARWLSQQSVYRSVALVMMILFTFWYWRSSTLHDLDRQITLLKTEQKQLEQFVEHGGPQVESSEYLTDWQAGDLSWQRELPSLLTLLPSTERIYLDQLQLELRAGTQTPRLRLRGYAREGQDVINLSQKFISERTDIQMFPRGIEPDSRNTLYPNRFDFELEIQLEDSLPRARSDKGEL